MIYAQHDATKATIEITGVGGTTQIIVDAPIDYAKERSYIRRSKNGTFKKYMYKVDIENVKSCLVGVLVSLIGGVLLLRYFNKNIKRRDMKYTNFEDYLKERFDKSYHGLDDDMPDAYEHWISNLDTSAVIDLVNDYGETMYKEGFGDALIDVVKKTNP